MFSTRLRLFHFVQRPTQYLMLSLNFMSRRHKYSIEKLARAPALPDDYEERNEHLKRALSPHLKIYKFEMPAQQSIAHRASGIVLSTYLVVLGCGALLLPNDFVHYIGVINEWDLNSYLITFGKFLFTLPFTIHFVGGVKHLVWDTMPACIKNMKSVFMAGYAVFALGTVFAALLALIKTCPDV